MKNPYNKVWIAATLLPFSMVQTGLARLEVRFNHETQCKGSIRGYGIG